MNKTILTFIIVVVIALQTGCSNGSRPRNNPVAVNGVLDLNNWDFDRQGPVALKGEWKFMWAEDSPEFSSPAFDDSEWDLIKVPGAWDSSTGTPYGLGWVRLKILLPPQIAEKYETSLSIEQLFEIFSSYELYINGVKILNNGFPSVENDTEVPSSEKRIVHIPLENTDRTLTIAFRISNHNFVYGGFHGQPRLGLIQNLQEQYIKENYKNYTLFGILLMMLIYHVILWLARRDDRASLYFALFCLVPLTRFMYITDFSQNILIGNASFTLHHRLSFLPLSMVLMFMPSFYAEMFPDEFHKKTVRLFQVSGSIAFIYIILTSVRTFSKIMLPLEILLLTCIIWVLINIIRAVINKKQEALIIFISMIVVISTLVNDMFFSFGYINTGFYSQVGFITLIFAQSTALSLRFARTYRTAEHLSRYLQEEVDRKTEDLTIRTREAEDAKKEIETVNKKLIEMDNYKNIFFQNITHEFRTPLTLIIGYMERNIENGFVALNPKIKEQYQIILSNSYRLLRLINQLLDISKIDAQMMKLNEAPCDVIQFIKNIKSSFETAAQKKNITYTFESDTDSLVVMLDREKLEKILFNILSNAFKFTDERGHISVNVNTSGANVSFTIKDSGTGIDESMLSRIFDRFYQVEQSTTRSREGTGIGLSLVKEYVDLYKGTVEVQSKKNEGTAFSISLPLHRLDPSTESRYSSEVNRETASVYTSDLNISGYGDNIDEEIEFSGKNHMVLVIDDNMDIRKYVKDILVQEYIVIEATDGVMGLKLALKHKPDLVISDIMMPGMDGYQLLTELRLNTSTSRIPVILLTAKSTEDEKIEGLEAGADDYLTKPFSSKELLARTRSLIRLYEYQKIIAERNNEIEADLEIAREIQSRLILEEYRATDRKNFHVVFYPLDKVAGDFYNFYETEEIVKIFIADVSGHGVAAAFLALITKNELDNTLSTHGDTMSVLHHLNKVINQYAVKCNFVTAFYCIYNKETYRLTYCRAGHNPPLLYRPSDNSVIELDTIGRALGFFPDIRFEEKHITLNRGDRLIFYTDGIIEARNSEGEMFELERLVEFIKDNRPLSPAELSEKLMNDITGFTGSNKFDDDVTLIVYDVV